MKLCVISTKSGMNSDDPSFPTARFTVTYLDIMFPSVVAPVDIYTNAQPFGHSLKVMCRAVALSS